MYKHPARQGSACTRHEIDPRGTPTLLLLCSSHLLTSLAGGTKVLTIVVIALQADDPGRAEMVIIDKIIQCHSLQPVSLLVRIGWMHLYHMHSDAPVHPSRARTFVLAYSREYCMCLCLCLHAEITCMVVLT